MSQEQEPRKDDPFKDAWEKDEKEGEKEREKTDEKQDESWEEKWRKDPVNAASWAIILIWAGIAFLIGNTMLDDSAMDGWDLALIGAGVVLLCQVAYRMMVPEHRRPVMGTVIFALVLLAMGLGDVVGWGALWPIVLILIGGSLLLRGVISRE